MKKLIFIFVILLQGCYHKSELKHEGGVVMAKQWEPDTRQTVTGTGISTGGNLVFTTHNIGHEEMYVVIFRCDHGVVFSVNSQKCWAELTEGQKVTIDYYEVLNGDNKIVDLDFQDARP